MFHFYVLCYKIILKKKKKSKMIKLLNALKAPNRYMHQY